MEKYQKSLIITLVSVCVLAGSTLSFAEDKNSLPVPRFASIKSNEVNLRTGPNVRYPIRWVFTRKGEPIEIIAEFEQWRKIRDRNGDDGWVHETMLSGKRMAIIIGKTSVYIYRKPNVNDGRVALAEPEVRIAIQKCKEEWCQVQLDDVKGWIERKYLWGVYNNEKID